MSEASALPRSGGGDDVFPEEEENSEMEGAMGMTSVDMTIRREVRGNFMDALQCIYCFKILQAPISVCGNGHSCCGDCRTKMNICGVCRGHFVSSRNRVVENLLMACATRCDFAELGCPEIIQLDKFEDHLAECAHKPDPPQPEPEPEPEFQVESPDGPEPDQLGADELSALLDRELDYLEERMADAERSTSDILIRLSVSVTMARNEAPAAATDRNRNDYRSEVTRTMSRNYSTRPVYLPPRPIRGPPSHQRVRTDMEHLRALTANRSSFVNRTLSRPSSVRRPVLSPARFHPFDRTYHPPQRAVNTHQVDSDFLQFARRIGRNPW